jgi:hypothetical protein
MTTPDTAIAVFEETFGPFEVHLMHEVLAIVNKAERHRDYAVLTTRQAETVVELLRWLGWPDYGTTTGHEDNRPIFLVGEDGEDI